MFQCLAALAPWPSAWPVGIILGLCGLAGLVNQAYVILKQFKLNIADPRLARLGFVFSRSGARL
jgi:hypothetical protein